MTIKYPEFVTITEVGMRDGFQFEEKKVPTDMKLEILEGLIEAGIQRIQVTSFVHPKWVPQMADAEELIRRLPQNSDVIFTGLVLNKKGLDRALKTDLKYVDLSISTNEKHSQDNANMSRDAAITQSLDIIDTARAHNLNVQMGLQCVWGYQQPGDSPLDLILEMAEQFLSKDIESLSLADSTGMANPLLIKKVVRAVSEIAGNTPIVLHLHDTRGLGLANVVAALECGVSHFDTSIGGLGGCPFIPGATGNIATEDTAYLLESLNINTDIERKKLAEVTSNVANFLGKELPGKLYKI